MATLLFRPGEPRSGRHLPLYGLSENVGGPYRSIVQVKEDAFSLLNSEPKPYFKVGGSGNRVN